MSNIPRSCVRRIWKVFAALVAPAAGETRVNGDGDAVRTEISRRDGRVLGDQEVAEPGAEVAHIQRDTGRQLVLHAH